MFQLLVRGSWRRFGHGKQSNAAVASIGLLTLYSSGCVSDLASKLEGNDPIQAEASESDTDEDPTQGLGGSDSVSAASETDSVTASNGGSSGGGGSGGESSSSLTVAEGGAPPNTSSTTVSDAGSVPSFTLDASVGGTSGAFFDSGAGGAAGAGAFTDLPTSLSDTAPALSLDAASPIVDSSTPLPAGIPAYEVAAGSITVDGDLTDFGSDGWQNLTVLDFILTAGSTLPDALDLSASFALRWTADTLFMAVRVSDELHVNSQTAGQIWNGDSVQFGFELDAVESGEIFDWEYGWALAGLTERAYQWAPSSTDLSNTLSFAIVRTAAETSYEFALPVARLGIVAIDPTVLMTMSMVVNESDDDALDREGYLALTPGLGETKSVDEFEPVTWIPL